MVLLDSVKLSWINSDSPRNTHTHTGTESDNSYCEEQVWCFLVRSTLLIKQYSAFIKWNINQLGGTSLTKPHRKNLISNTDDERRRSRASVAQYLFRKTSCGKSCIRMGKFFQSCFKIKYLSTHCTDGVRSTLGRHLVSCCKPESKQRTMLLHYLLEVSWSRYWEGEETSRFLLPPSG